jgi:DNA/RNA-binding domain of Phe-tRNA-synthetase-like protein
MDIRIDSRLKTRFPNLTALQLLVKGVQVKRKDDKLEEVKAEIIRQVREKYSLESLKDVPTFRAYRDFYWFVGIDPTKNRPASEALTRRLLGGRGFPRINTLVDAYNIASVKTEIALAAFDANTLSGELVMTYPERGTTFLGIGMKKPMPLQGSEIVVVDKEKLVAIYPYRDADDTKVTEKTKNVMLLVCGVPSLRREMLLYARKVALKYIDHFCKRI